MAYTNFNFKSKKSLKEAIKNGQLVEAHQPGLGPDLSQFTGTVCLEGPHYPAAHTWYAEAEMKSGAVVSVK